MAYVRSQSDTMPGYLVLPTSRVPGFTVVLVANTT